MTGLFIGGLIIVSVTLTPAGRLEVVKREPSNSMYPTYPPHPVPDKVWLEIYEAQDGRIKLVERVEGVHTPETLQPETIVFPSR